MCGNETQIFHFLSAFSSGEYFTSLTGLLMSKGGSCSSTVKGYHFLACAYAPKLASASTALAATAPAATSDRFMSASCILLGQARPAFTLRCTSCPKPTNHYPYGIFGMSIVPARLDGLSRRIVENTFADAAIDLFRKIAERRFERLSALVRRSIPERLLTGSFVTSS